VDYKPADFFVGIIDLFGVLIPGAIFTYLHGNYLLCLVGTQLPSGNGMPHIGGFVVVSLLLGHFLLGCSTPLNVLVDIFWKESNDQYYKEVKPDISLPAGRKREETRTIAPIGFFESRVRKRLRKSTVRLPTTNCFVA
jgi:polyferredoxin